MDCGSFCVADLATDIGEMVAQSKGVFSSTYWQCVDTEGVCIAATHDREAPPQPMAAFMPQRMNPGLWGDATIFQGALVHLDRLGDIINVSRTCTWLHDAACARLVPVNRVNIAISDAVDMAQHERRALLLTSVGNGGGFPKAAYMAKCAPSILHAITTIPLCEAAFRPGLLRAFVIRMAGFTPSIADLESRYGYLLRLKWHSHASTGKDPVGIACVAAWKACFADTLAWCRALDHNATRSRARYDLMIAELYAPAISVVDMPATVVKAVVAGIYKLPLPYWPRVIDAALPICPDSRAIYGKLLDLVMLGDGALPPMSTRVVAEMAALMLCVVSVQDVRGYFISHYGFDERYIETDVEPYVATILVQEALSKTRIRPSLISKDSPIEALPLSSMSRVDHWSVLDKGLMSCVHSAFITAVARRAVAPISEWYSLSDATKATLRENVFCMATPTVSALVSDLHRFWTIYEEIQHIDERAGLLQMWDDIMDIPWQLQPTMAMHLLSARNAVALSGRARIKLQRAVFAWAQAIVPKCLAAGHPRLAGRAAASVLKLMSAEKPERSDPERANDHKLVQFALTVSTPIPVWALAELLSGIASVLTVYEQSMLGAGCSRTLDARVTAFLGDKSVSLLYPSSTMMMFLIARSVQDWRVLPESGLPIGHAFDAYFDRFHFYSEKVRNLFTNLLRIKIAQDTLSGALSTSAPVVHAWFGLKEAKRGLLNDIEVLRAALLNNA
jgi:hypothetical protein